MKIYPIEIQKLDSTLNIKWSDGSLDNLPFRRLRENCPCAECREARTGIDSHRSPLTPRVTKGSLLNIVDATAEEETTLNKIWQIGNYAIGLIWEDGHSAGIYTYDTLRELTKVN